VLKKSVASIRAAALEAGRKSSAIKIFNMQTVIVDETDAKAQAKYKSYRDYVSVEGALALLWGWLGCDFGAYEPDTPLSGVNARSVQSSLEAYAAVEGGGLKTVRDLAEWVGVGGFGHLFVGGPSTVADLMQEWIEETDVDGFNLTTRSRTKPLPMSQAISCRSCSVATCSSATTRRGRFARSCLALALASAKITPRPYIGIWRLQLPTRAP
jgi:alkanesulfonate monooxygenase SsuD/methylene tetrahydromethanopterin reductase-like flavin-dependent oxidoreductase (luciferase family)